MGAFAFPAVALEIMISGLLLAGMALIALVMLQALVSTVAPIIRTIPGIGDAIANWLEERLNDLSDAIGNGLRSAVNAAIQPVIDFMTHTADNQRAEAYSQRSVMMYHTYQLNELSGQAMSGVPDGTRQYVDKSSADVFVAGEQNLENAYATATQYTHDSYSQLSSWAGNAVQTIEDDIRGPGGTVAGVANELRYELQGVQSNAFSAIAQSQAETLQTADEHSAVIAAALGDAITEEAANRGFGDAAVRDHAEQRLQEETAPLVAGQTAITTYLGTVVATAIADTTTWRNDCGDPLCAGLLGMARGMSGFLRTAELGALIALIMSAAVDPEHGADTITNAIEPLIDAPRSIFDALSGLS